jgi:YD repeat-containing protein
MCGLYTETDANVQSAAELEATHSETNASASQFIVNNKNELTNAPAIPQITYDANGNMTTYSAGNLNTYTYDDENRLVDFLNPVLGNETVFVYDGLGRLRIRQEYQGAPSSPIAVEGPIGGGSLVSETWYIYDGKRVIQERNGTNNTPLVSYTRGPRLKWLDRRSRRNWRAAGALDGKQRHLDNAQHLFRRWKWKRHLHAEQQPGDGGQLPV